MTLDERLESESKKAGELVRWIYQQVPLTIQCHIRVDWLLGRELITDIYHAPPRKIQDRLVIIVELQHRLNQAWVFDLEAVKTEFPKCLNHFLKQIEE